MLLVFSGCSFTAGQGWVNEDSETSRYLPGKDHPNLWTNLCYSQIDQFKNLYCINAGQGGASNTDIFVNTTQAIAEHSDNINTVFCQWTSMPRYNFNVGLELWKTRVGLSPGARSLSDINLSNGDRWDKKYVDDILDRIRALHHLHPEILKVVEYSNILEKLAKNFNFKIYFINGLCPWDNEYFVRLTDVSPEDFTPFTKKEILEIEHRSDEDIFKLYKKIHNDYARVGGINSNIWINLYDSMLKNIIDTNYDNRHAGTKSNQIFFQQIKNFLEIQQ